jgi:hypothetical protein
MILLHRTQNLTHVQAFGALKQSSGGVTLPAGVCGVTTLVHEVAAERSRPIAARGGKLHVVVRSLLGPVKVRSLSPFGAAAWRIPVLCRYSLSRIRQSGNKSATGTSRVMVAMYDDWRRVLEPPHVNKLASADLDFDWSASPCTVDRKSATLASSLEGKNGAFCLNLCRRQQGGSGTGHAPIHERRDANASAVGDAGKRTLGAMKDSVP